MESPTEQSTCPFCRGAMGSPRRRGAVEVATCERCGHGRLRSGTSNEDFESEDYAAWRAENQGWVGKVAQRYLDDLVALTGALPASAAETGCATGEVLGALASRGAACWGADLSAASIAVAAAAHPAVRFAVAALPSPDRPVDAFFAFHVVEHLADPMALLTAARDLVTDDGLLYVRVPNYGSVHARVLRGAWPGYDPGHEQYFTARSLEIAVGAAGWDVVARTTRSRAWPWIVGVSRTLTRSTPTSGDGGSPPGTGRGRLRLLQVLEWVMTPVSRLEERLGVGNELVLVVRRAPDRRPA